MTRALMVLTGARSWTMKDGTPHPTGFWAEEFIKPHTAFTQAGLEVGIATPGGVTPAVDELSMSKTYYDDETIAAQRAYLGDLESQLSSTLKLENVSAADWDVVFQVGGHGPMQDLAVCWQRALAAGGPPTACGRDLPSRSPPGPRTSWWTATLLPGQQQVSAEKAARAVLEQLKITTADSNKHWD